MDQGLPGAVAKGRLGKRSIAPDRLSTSVCNTPILPGWLVCLDPGEGDRDIHLEAGLKEAGEQTFVRDMAGIEGVTMTRIGPHPTSIKIPVRLQVLVVVIFLGIEKISKYDRVVNSKINRRRMRSMNSPSMINPILLQFRP